MADIFDSREVHVWYFGWDAAPPANLVRALYSSLSSEEEDRFRRFRFDRDRHAHLLAHGLLRRVLSLCHPAGEDSWRFQSGGHGKPYIASPECDLCFSLTHTAGMVACAISVRAEVGVDIERIDRPCDFLGLARSSFAPGEANCIENAPLPLRAERFFTFWTLKEAYVKGRGLGLSLPLQDFEVRLEAGGATAAVFLGRAQASESDWHFRLFRPTTSHILAAAVRMVAFPEFVLHDGADLLYGPSR